MLSTLGDHVKARRIGLGLRQSDLASLFGVNKFTVANWEKGRSSPAVPQCGAVIQFLGYDPFPEPKTFAERLVTFRRRRGLRVRDAAMLAGVDPSTWSDSERKGYTSLAIRKKMEKVLPGGSSPTFT